ncbi:MAG TPA: hypothetical protein VIH06_15150, partial [Ilumatobacteraceae bacterium]
MQTMPPGSGLEAVIESVRLAILDRYPTADVSHLMRKNFMMTDIEEIEYVAANFDAAVLVSGPAATMVHLAVVFADHLEQRGTPATLVHFDALARSARHSIGTVGAPVRACRFGSPSHPDAESNDAAQRVVDSMVAPLTDDECRTGVRVPAPKERIASRGTLEEVLEHFHAQGWTDGLPIVPPTEENVGQMLLGTSRRRDEVVTDTFRPEARRATVEMVAMAAVMAGAKAEHLPVILATASVFGDLQFESMTRSVNSFGFAQLVNGPIAAEIGMTGGLGALGPGNRANAAIGRTLNLLFRTVGGARLGVNVTPTQGSAISYALAFAENESGSPWAPFHVDQGFRADESTVSILIGGWAHNGNFYYGGLAEVAETLTTFEIPQTGAFVMLTEKRAHQLADAGYTKESIATELHERATIRLG